MGGGASYLNFANLLNPTPQIADRLFNAYQTDLPRKEDSVDEVESWKFGWALVDDKPERLLDTLHVTNRDLCSSIYSIISILLTISVSSATSDRSFIAMRRVKSYLRWTVGFERLSNFSLLCIYRDVQVDLDMIINDFVSRKNRILDFS